MQKKICRKYDLIIMKSVLGGIFRTNNSNISQINDLIKKLIKNNLNENCILFTMDNGIGFTHNFKINFGAGKNNWRFFRKNQLLNNYSIEQKSFGYFSNFCLETRLPLLGKFVDYINYLADRIIFLFNKNSFLNNAIIVNIYKYKK